MSEVGGATRENAVPEISFFTDTYTIASDIGTNGMVLSISHGLPKQPRYVWAQLVCTTAEIGYSVGDTVNAVGGLRSVETLSLYANKNTIGVVFTNVPYVINPSTQAITAITPANWNLVVNAEV
jgi:hypothetical protein